jgi:glycosyltransferase involved in cell wall biosynthesis
MLPNRKMKRPLRIGFAMEQTLGHVAYGLSLRKALAKRDDVECHWLDVPFSKDGLGRIPVIGSNWTVRGSVRAARAIARSHGERGLDALFVHTQTIGLFSGGLMSKIPTLMSVDATPVNYDELARHYGDVVHAAPIERVKLWAHRAVMRRTRWFTTWSQWAKDSLVRDYGVAADKVTVIHPGSVLANFPAPNTRRKREGGPLRVLFVGGDFPRKGGDLLLEAEKALRGKIELHLVTGADVPTSPGVFVYRGLKPHSPELLRRYAEADVFVLPTRADCLAVVLGEAMASSLPIITTKVGAHAEAVEDGKSGYVIDVDDIDALRDRLERLANDAELVLRMGRRAREVGEERFDMDKNANRIADILVGLRKPVA